jgi:thiosulfate/3-mercaptopyruvate sulfurtransferase
MTNSSEIFVSPQWLTENLGKPGLTIIDASWYLPAQNRDAKAEYERAHVPGAVFFDHDQVVDPDSSLPHALPRPADFARMAGSMGVAVDDTIVVYDGPGLFSAPRARWMFRLFGATDVRILAGGFDNWKADGFPVSGEVTRIAPCVFTVTHHAEGVASLDEVRAAVDSGSSQIADARPAGRFTAAEPEPRPGMRGGHMPGARNLPALSLSRNGELLPPEALAEKVAAAGIDLDKPVIASCGSGVTAAVVALALESLGHRNVKLYDGSWSEWGARDDTPVVAGEA